MVPSCQQKLADLGVPTKPGCVYIRDASGEVFTWDEFQTKTQERLDASRKFKECTVVMECHNAYLSGV